MALVSKSKAAKLAGVSRTTIHRYVNDGKLSMTGDKVDTSELMRVFGSLSDAQSEQSGTPVTVNTSAHDVTPDVQGVDTYKISLLEQQLTDVKQDRDAWRDKASELTQILQDNTRLLTHQTGDNKVDNWPLQKIVIIGLMAFIAALAWFILTTT